MNSCNTYVLNLVFVKILVWLYLFLAFPFSTSAKYNLLHHCITWRHTLAHALTIRACSVFYSFGFHHVGRLLVIKTLASHPHVSLCWSTVLCSPSPVFHPYPYFNLPEVYLSLVGSNSYIASWNQITEEVPVVIHDSHAF